METDRSRARSFPARTGALPEAAAFIAEICAAAGFRRDTCLKLTLLVEELFTNTIVHGHKQESEEPVRLAFEVRPGRIALTYEDTAPPHDPFAGVTAPDEAATVEDRLVGGLGVLLVSSMARDVEYRRVDGKNRIRLIITAPE
jgi:serine/threonine-protein kinase RsbW